MASETDDGDDCIADILAASDELSRVIDRYKFVVLRGRTDSAKKDVPAKTIPATNTISRPLQRKNSEELLDLGGGGDQGSSLPKQTISFRKPHESERIGSLKLGNVWIFGQ